MDDLKLYSSRLNHMIELIDITTKFSSDIKMDLGLDKCRKLNLVKGKVVPGNYDIGDEQQIIAMNDQDLYKYLGFNQARTLNHKTIKHKLKNEYFQRLNTICKTQLNSKNLFKALNTYAIPILTYSFGIITWTQTDLKNLETKTRSTLTKYRYNHPKSAKERTTISRKEGGRGLIDITLLHDKQIKNLRHFFTYKKNISPLHRAITQIDKKYTPLNLISDDIQTLDHTKYKQDKLNSWINKELHGRHPKDLQQAGIDKEASNKWLDTSGLFPETEGFLIAIQDQVISTKNYRKYIIKDKTIKSDLCRKCCNKPETIQHITGACITLTKNDYTHRHNQLVNILHQKLCLKHKIQTTSPIPYYKYTPPTILENGTHKIYYDRTILTDHTIYNNRPDITLVDKQNKHCYLIDVAVPNTNNLQNTITEKIRKYTELQLEVKRIWKLNKVTIVPIVISTTGVIPKHIFWSLSTLGLSKFTYLQLQKAVILNTCRIVRKFLQLDADNIDFIPSQ